MNFSEEGLTIRFLVKGPSGILFLKTFPIAATDVAPTKVQYVSRSSLIDL